MNREPVSAVRPQRKIQDRTLEFAGRIVDLHQFLQKKGDTARTLSGQILRSGTSIGANLEEADAGQSKPDFISKCNIALKEARETHYWFKLITNADLVPKKRLDPLIGEADERISILIAIIRKASLSKNRG